MGQDLSKEQDVKQIGDQQVTVIENQEVHTEALAQSDVKLWIILVMVALQLLIIVAKLANKLLKRNARKAAIAIQNA